MKISRQEVEHVARLAQLNLSDEELGSMTQQLDGLLAYFDQLAKVDTAGVVPTTHTFNKTNAFREDCVSPSLPSDQALANAPQAQGDTFQVPRVI